MGKYNSAWIHGVWTVKNRRTLLTLAIREKVFEYLQHNAQFEQYHIKAIGGIEDHIHCLFTLPATSTIAQVVKRIKGSSSRFINELGTCPEIFGWQSGYASISVSPNEVGKVMDYINNQEVIHRKRSYKYERELIFT